MTIMSAVKPVVIVNLYMVESLLSAIALLFILCKHEALCNYTMLIRLDPQCNQTHTPIVIKCIRYFM